MSDPQETKNGTIRFDSLFITGGLAASPTQTLKQPNPQALATFLKDNVADPTYSIGKLR